MSNQQKVNLSWSIEAIWALTWVGNKHKNLTFNTIVEDTLASSLPDFKNNESSNNFISNFECRSENEIYKKLDLFYRAHWFAKHKNLNGEKTDLVNHSIIIERRTALEWVSNNSIPIKMK